MNVYYDYHTRPDSAVFAAIGCFDGLHLGHQAMLEQLKQQAKSAGKKTAVITFSPLPNQFFRGAHNTLLMPLEQKLALLAKWQIDQVWVLPFDQPFSHLSKSDFLHILQAQLCCEQLFVGEDFHFGYRGEGDVAYLQSVSGPDFSVNVMPNFCVDGQRVSSSGIREFLLAGDFAAANHWLGRAFYYASEVIHGEKLGRQLGAPTANLALSDTLIMPHGVFVARAELSEPTNQSPAQHFHGVCNMGRRPTLPQTGDTLPARLLEIHLLGRQLDLYGKTLRVFPQIKLRDEQKFADLTALREQIHKDIQAAKDYIASKPAR